MKLTIEAESKEIADLVLKLQNRQDVKKTVNLYPDGSNSTHAEAIRGMHENNSMKSAHDE